MWFRIFHSETIKMLSYRWCVFAIGCLVLISPIVLMCSESYEGNEQSTVIVAVLQMLYLSQIGAALIGGTIMGQEYAHSALRTSLLAVPSRKGLLIVKLMLLSVVVILSMSVATFLCLLWMVCNNDVVITYDLVITLAKHLVPVIISGLEVAVISAGLSIIFRSIVIPIAIMLPMILGLSQILFSFFVISKYTPVLATLNVFIVPSNEALLNNGFGLMVQLIWAVAILLIAGNQFIRRDIR